MTEKMTHEHIPEQIQADLKEAKNWDHPIPEVVFKRAKEKLNQKFREDPEAVERVQYVTSWVAGALHRSMMEEASGNRLTIPEIADLYGITEQPVSDRSKTLRNVSSASGEELSLDQLDMDESDLGEVNSVSDVIELVASSVGAKMEQQETQLNVDLLEPVTEDVNVQIDVDGQFDMDRFYSDHDVSQEQQDSFYEAAKSGVTAYVQFVRGEEWGDPGAWGMRERLGNPNVFGFAAKEVVNNTQNFYLQDIVARYTVGLLVEVKKNSRLRPPAGAAAPVGWLASHGILQGEPLYVASRLALKDRSSLMHLDVEDLRSFWHSVLTDESLEADRKMELMHIMLSRTSQTGNPHFGPQLLEEMHRERSDFDTLYDQLLEEFVMMKKRSMFDLPPRAVRSKAFEFLVQRADDLTTLIKRVSENAFSRKQDPLLEAMGEAIQNHHDRLDKQLTKELIEKGIRHGRVDVRRAFFEAAEEIGMEDVLSRAHDDRAKSIRFWAREQSIPS